MPVRDTLIRKTLPDESALQAELENELRSPSESGEPDIVIERPHPSTTHLFVIWSKFEHVDQAVRSSIILEAYTAARGTAEAHKVTVAMGVTQEEAKRMGLS